MSLTISQSDEKDFEIVPAGVYTARCYQVVDLGTQEVQTQGGVKLQHKAMIRWEILNDEIKMDDGKPFSVGKKYTLSLFEGAYLYKDLVSWRGKAFTAADLEGFNISNLLGVYVTLQVIHEPSKDGKRTYANVQTLMKYQGKEKPKPVNKDVLLELEVDTFDQEAFNNLIDYLKKQIVESPEYQNIMANKVPAEKTDDGDVREFSDDEAIDLDDIPF